MQLRKLLGLGPSNREILGAVHDMLVDQKRTALQDHEAVMKEIADLKETVQAFRDGLKKELEQAIDSRTENMRAFVGLHTKYKQWHMELLRSVGLNPVEPEEKP